MCNFWLGDRHPRQSMLQRPRRLRPGDRVRVVAPAGPFQRDRFEAGVAWLRTRYEVVVGDEVYDVHRYAAGRLDRRQAGLLTAVEDPDTRAIFCARGGFGTMHLLPALDLRGRASQVLVGFSDVTALHLAWHAAGRPSVHGPVVTQLGEIDDGARAALVAILEEPAPPPPLPGTGTLVAGRARGPLVGGNLAVLASLVGTPFLPPLAGAVLLLEDVAEPPYRIDRMWTQLAFAGVFDQVAGVVLGGFTGCDPRDGSYTLDEVLADLAAAAGVPCAAGFPVGHGAANVPLPLGVEVELDATSCRLAFRQGLVT